MPRLSCRFWTEAAVLLALVLWVAGCTAGAGAVPAAVSVSVSAYNEGSEDSQYVEIHIGFADSI